MTLRFAPVYFTDENALGLGKLLCRSGRDDVVYPGHESSPRCRSGHSIWTGCPSSASAA